MGNNIAEGLKEIAGATNSLAEGQSIAHLTGGFTHSPEVAKVWAALQKDTTPDGQRTFQWLLTQPPDVQQKYGQLMRPGMPDQIIQGYDSNGNPTTKSLNPRNPGAGAQDVPGTEGMSKNAPGFFQKLTNLISPSPAAPTYSAVDIQAELKRRGLTK